MLHKDPDHKSRRRAKYAKMLLESVFIEEQPKNEYERVFGSTSTVVSAATIAAEQGAYIPNIAQLLFNPGSTRQSSGNEDLIEAASHAVPTPGTLAAAHFASARHPTPTGRQRKESRKPRPPSPNGRPTSDMAALRVCAALGNKSAAAAASGHQQQQQSSLSESSGGGGAKKQRPAGHKGVMIKAPEDETLDRKAAAMPDRRFFAHENLLRAKSHGLPDEEVLSVLVSSALHLNDDVDELADPELAAQRDEQEQGKQRRQEEQEEEMQRQKEQQQQQEKNASPTSGGENNNVGVSFEVESSTSSSSNTKPLSHKHSSFLSSSVPPATVTPGDRINPEIQHAFRCAHSVFQNVPAPDDVIARHHPHHVNIFGGSDSQQGGGGGGGYNMASPGMASVVAAGADSRMPSPQQRVAQLAATGGGVTTDSLDATMASMSALAGTRMIHVDDPPGTFTAAPAPPAPTATASPASPTGAAVAAATVTESAGASPSGNSASDAASGTPLKLDANALAQQHQGGDGSASPQPASPAGASSPQLGSTQPGGLAEVAALQKMLQLQGGAVVSPQRMNNLFKPADPDSPPPPPILDGRLASDECIALIEHAFPDLKVTTIIQQALVCDDQVEDLYFQTVGDAQGEDVPEVRRGTLSVHEAEDLLFASYEPALDLFLFLGAYDPKAPEGSETNPLAMPVNVDGMESWLKLRQRLQVLNGRFDKIQRSVQDMLTHQQEVDDGVEVKAFAQHMAAMKKKKAKMARGPGAGGGDDEDGGGGGGGAAGAHGGGGANQADNDNNDPGFTSLDKREGPLPFAVNLAGAMNCFDLQQLILPMTRLCEFEIIPWCVLDIYCAALYPTLADLGFVGMYSKDPPLIDFEMFCQLLAVHRLVLHRREDQVLAIRRMPVGPAPATPWMPIVQRRVLRQTVLVAQAHKRGKFMHHGSSGVGSGFSGATSSGLLASGRSYSMSSSGTGLMGQSGRSMSMMSGMARSETGATLLTAPSGLLDAPGGHGHGHGHGHHRRLQRSNSQHSLAAASEGGGGGTTTGNNSTGDQSGLGTPSAHKDLLSLPLDDGVEAEQSYAEFVGEDELMEENELRSNQILDQVHSIQFRERALPDPPHNLVGVAPTWPEEADGGKLTRWREAMRDVPSRCNLPEEERPLSYQKLPLYDEDDRPVYDGPSKLTQQYAEILERAGPPPFAVRKLDKDAATKTTRFDRIRPVSAKQWRQKDPVDGRSVVSASGVVAQKPLKDLRSGMYWFAADPDKNAAVASAEEMEQLKERFVIEQAKTFEREQRQQHKSQQQQVEKLIAAASGSPLASSSRNNSPPAQRPPGSPSQMSHVSSTLAAGGILQRRGSDASSNGGNRSNASSTSAPSTAALGLSMKRPFYGMTRSHVPCNPPPLAAFPPPTRPASATMSAAARSRGAASVNKNKLQPVPPKQQQQQQPTSPSVSAREALEIFNQNPQVPQFRGATPVFPQLQHDIFSEYCNQKEQQQQHQEQQQTANRPQTSQDHVASAPRFANIYLQKKQRPCTAGYGRQQQQPQQAQQQQPYTGFHREIRPSSALTSGSTQSRVADFLRSGTAGAGGHMMSPIPVRRESPTTAAASSRGVSPPAAQSRYELVEKQIREQQQQKEQQLQQQQQHAQGAGANAAASLQQQYGHEASIPSLTLDQSNSFHALLRDARREAEQRVAQQSAMDAITRQQAQQEESPEAFHENVMSWYKRQALAGRSYMKGTSPKREKRSPVRGGSPPARRFSILDK